MSVRLVLQLPFGVTLVYKQEFQDDIAALEVAANLPSGFEVVHTEEALVGTIEVPFKEPKCVQKTS